MSTPVGSGQRRYEHSVVLHHDEDATGPRELFGPKYSATTWQRALTLSLSPSASGRRF